MTRTELWQKLKTLYGVSKDPVTFVLAVFAIGFAIYQFKDSQELKSGMQGVINNASTRYIGPPLKSIYDIDKVIKDSHEQLDIMVDVVAWGQYSAPDKCFEYVQSLESLRNRSPKVRVRMVIFNPELQRELLREQFPVQDFEQEKKRPRFDEFFRVRNSYLGLPTTYDEFLEKLLKRQQDYQDQLNKEGIEIATANWRYQVYVWLQDDRESVVSFQNTQEGDVSFLTRDGNLNTTFRRMFDRTWPHPGKTNKM